MDFWAPTHPHREDDDMEDRRPPKIENILQVVSHRELLIGCHSFDEYLSPHFHTLLVFPRRVAVILGLPDLVRRATASQTAGVHLFLTDGDGYAGSHMARRIAERFAGQELDTRSNGPKIRYLSAINCDVHPLPSTHERYRPLEDIVVSMARDLRIANRYQGPDKPIGSPLVSNYDAQGYAVDGKGAPSSSCSTTREGDDASDCRNGTITPHARRRILAMNTILFEDVPDDTSLEKFHGVDNVDWWAKGGWDRREEVMTALRERLRNRGIAGRKDGARNDPEGKDNLPWLQDESNFFEDHMIVFDLKYLREFSDVYFAVAPEAFVDENSFLGPMAAQYGFTLVRHNDMVLRMQFGHDTVPFPPTVDVDAIRRLNWQMLGHFRSPRSMAANWERAASLARIRTDHRPFVPFVYMHCHRHVWFPMNWKNSTIVTDPDVLPILDGYLAYSGYMRLTDGRLDEVKSLRYGLDGIHPATRLVRFGKEKNALQKRFLSVPRSGGKRLKFRRLYVDRAYAGPPDLNRTSVLTIPAKTTISPEWFDACREE